MTTRWLTDQEQAAWRTFLRATLLLDEELDRQLRRDEGMPHAYYQILAMLSEAPDRRLTMSQLSDITRFSASRLSHAFARLERDGLVQRERDTTDRRIQHASLTDAGWERVRSAAPGHVAAVAHHLFDRLDAEQVDQLRTIAERILGGLPDAASRQPPG